MKVIPTIAFLLIATAASAQSDLPMMGSQSALRGPVEGGTRIVIRGRNLLGPNPVPCPPGCNATRVTIGPNDAHVVSSSDDAIVAVTRATAAGKYAIVVTRADGQSTSRSAAFEFADSVRPLTAVMLPLVIKGELPGALGSRWITEIAGRNESDQPVIVSQTPGVCALLFCAPVYRDPRTTFRPAFNVGQRSGAGAKLFIENKTGAELVSFTLRIRDVSRESEGWGTELPVVREQEAYPGGRPLQLLDIPVDSRFRRMLRLYDFDGPSDMTLRVDVLAHAGDELLASKSFQFDGGPVTFEGAPEPGYLQVDLAELVPSGHAASRVRIRITTAEHWRRFWAFVTVTNNETQQVTAVTPQ